MENQEFITMEQYEEIKKNALAKYNYRIGKANELRAKRYMEIDTSNRYGMKAQHIESEHTIECVNALAELDKTAVPALSRVR